MLVFLGCVYFFWGRFFIQSYQTYKNWEIQHLSLKDLIKFYQQQIDKKKYFIQKMTSDPYFREQVTKERSNSLKSNEYLIRFRALEQMHLEPMQLNK
jgi:hypothetical protein